MEPRNFFILLPNLILMSVFYETCFRNTIVMVKSKGFLVKPHLNLNPIFPIY